MNENIFRIAGREIGNALIKRRKMNELYELREFFREQYGFYRELALKAENYPDNIDNGFALAYGVAIHMVELLIENPGFSLKEIDEMNP